jgi:acyl carrier protein
MKSRSAIRSNGALLLRSRLPCCFVARSIRFTLPVIVLGVIERFVESELRPKLRDGDDDLRLVEDLGVDSLTMMEIVMLVEEVLQMQTNNDELRNLRTVGDVKTFIDCKIRGLPLPKPTKFIPVEQVVAVMPIQPPFLFINEAQVGSAGAQGNTRSRVRNFFSKGTSRTIPCFRRRSCSKRWGSSPCSTCLRGRLGEAGRTIDPTKIFFTSCEGVRCHRVCRPGDVLTLSIRAKRAKMPLATFEGSIRVGQEKAAVAEEITLTFAYAEEAPVHPPVVEANGVVEVARPPVATVPNLAAAVIA